MSGNTNGTDPMGTARLAVETLNKWRFEPDSKSLDALVKECIAYDEWEQGVAHERRKRRIAIKTSLAQLKFEIRESHRQGINQTNGDQSK